MNTKATKKSSVAKVGVITGGTAFVLTVFLGITANSLALWADCAATFLDFMAVFIAWQGFKKVETQSTEKFNYGYGKFESFSSLGMSILMIISFVCIMIIALIRFSNPVAVTGMGVVIGMGAHTIFGVINGSLFFKSIQLDKQDKSSLSSAQRRMYLVKFSANILMVATLILSYFLHQYKWAMYADPVTATIIALMILSNATKIFKHSSRDLLDYALEEQSQLLILRSLANHFDRYENIKDIRTRASGGKIYVEIFLEFDGNLKHSEVMETVNSMQNEITELLNCDEVLIIPV
ncbi:MAG: cation diffusion facilitator family transporter [Candidatus Cloacimonetes bacterium]|nr:cation diffusion facilitator family transporter [Candidatus Cloacimonadota bacterium]MCF7813915.1 cation diffusion facilitator family transporter [Candidatus Cloacimonadota bacterium]MCF7868512.1 cation diffusion facilitator family transporter [Candidatus Cloacimonadota bacterium]MCF7884027.1 cation diffusion facilitator family transporter [Candidatus Cloacimonadota bacterium]